MFRCDDRCDDDVNVVDFPLLAWLRGNDRDFLLRAERTIDAADLDWGRPMFAAEQGRYGRTRSSTATTLQGSPRCPARGHALTPLAVFIVVAVPPRQCWSREKPDDAGLAESERTLFECGAYTATRSAPPALADGDAKSRDDARARDGGGRRDVL